MVHISHRYTAAPGGECCAGVRRIRGIPSGTAERRQACECVKQAAAGYQPLNADAIRDLPKQCGAPLPFPLTLNFDCTTCVYIYIYIYPKLTSLLLAAC